MRGDAAGGGGGGTIGTDIVAKAAPDGYTMGLSHEHVCDDAEPVGNTPEEYAASIKADLARWAKVVAATGIRAD